MKRSSSKLTLNPLVLNAEYAVRGAVAVRAGQLEQELQAGQIHPFKKVIYCNIGNPQQLKQKPITFFRQVAALLETGVEHTHGYPQDAVDRATMMVKECGGNIGAYSHSKGINFVRQHVAEFIEERDGHPANPENIFLTNGASQGVHFIMQSLISSLKGSCGVMIPIPQYPLYTATLALMNGVPVPYYLNESQGWSMELEELKRSFAEAQKQNLEVSSLVVINPGNPTGNLLSRKNMEEVVKFCEEQNLVLLADEVYQENVYLPGDQFVSFKKVVSDLKSRVQLISFHSISKGIIGECGRRGGYFEMVNFDDDVVEQVYKLASISLCPNVHGQFMVDLMVKPPQPGTESYDKYIEEVQSILQSMKRRAKKLVSAFNEMEGVSCQAAAGAMYVFPSITLPAKAIEDAKSKGIQPDSLYVMDLLNETGVCVVNGSGFGQKEGTYHFRSTFLPPEEDFDEFIGHFKSFHSKFMAKYQ